MAKTQSKQLKSRKNKISKPKKDKGKKKHPKKYKVRNWSEYNESLVQRGSLEVWIEENILKDWRAQGNGKRGGQPIYSDLAIKLTLQFGQVFRQKLRQTEGLVRSVFKLMQVDLEVPDYSTLSRRGETVVVRLAKDHKDKVALVIDGSGLKVYGEGEWKVRQHGYSKHRTWRKIHVALTPDGELRAVDLTPNSISDDAVFANLIQQETARIEKVAADGAYDRRKVYQVCQQKEIQQVAIPPQENAKIWQHGNCKAPPHPRDINLRLIRKTSRKRWKELVGFNTRSLAETAVFRFKTIFGDHLNARKLPTQLTEVLIKTSILNKMRTIGMPESYLAT